MFATDLAAWTAALTARVRSAHVPGAIKGAASSVVLAVSGILAAARQRVAGLMTRLPRHGAGMRRRRRRQPSRGGLAAESGSNGDYPGATWSP